MSITTAPTMSQITEAETANRFDVIRARFGLFAVIPLIAAALFLPQELPWDQRAMLATLGFVVLFWITETIPIPVTALIGIAMLVLLGAGSPGEVYGAFGSPTVFLVIGAFILARAMTVHGLDRRFALKVLSLPRVGDSTYLTACAFMLVAIALSMLVSASATAVMLLPIGIGVVRTVGDLIHGDSSSDKRKYQTRFSCMLMLAISYGAGVGSVLTPVTGIANVIGRGTVEQMTGYQIPLMDWLTISAPYVLCLGVVMFAAIVLMNRPETRHIPNGSESFRADYLALGSMTRAEKIVTAIFSITVFLWIAPALVTTFNLSNIVLVTIADHLNEGSVVVFMAAMLFLIPAAKKTPTLEWKEATKINWGTVILVGVGLTIGAMMKQTGLAETIGDAVAQLTGVNSVFLLCFVAIVLGMLISETTSNTASVGIIVPIIIPISIAIGVDPLIPAMAAIFGGNAGAMLPVSTPPNAIVYGSGYVPMLRMIRTGVVADILTIPLILLAVIGIGTFMGLYLPA